MKIKLFLLLFIGATFTSVNAQTRDKAKLDSYFDALEANNRFMGTVQLSENGKRIYTRSIGITDADKKTKIDANTKFRIGSISKMFTAALVFKAVEANKLQLSDRLGAYYPSIPKAAEITIAQLLGHRSGIHNFTDNDDYTNWLSIAKSESELVSIIEKGGSDFTPGSKASYSNSNYVLLTYILQKVYKKPFGEILNEKIIKPLALKNTRYGGKINTAKNEAQSFKFNGKWETDTETDMSIPLGAGAVVSTPSDLALFIEALFAGKIISATSLEQMKTTNEGYGLGMFQVPFGQKKGYGHTGGIDGFTSMLGHIAEDNLTIALTSNGNNFNNNDIAIAALSWYYNKPFDVPEFKSFVKSTAELDKYIGTYASTEIPIKITVTKKDLTLSAQASGQSAFPLESKALNIFEYKAAGALLEFKPETSQVILKQGGRSFTFVRE